MGLLCCLRQTHQKQQGPTMTEMSEVFGEEQVEKFREIFSKFDVNGDGG